MCSTKKGKDIKALYAINIHLFVRSFNQFFRITTVFLALSYDAHDGNQIVITKCSKVHRALVYVLPK